MKTTFTDYKSWEAAAVARGLRVRCENEGNEGMHESDQWAGSYALDGAGCEVGAFLRYKDDAKLFDDYYGGALSKEEADAAWDALPTLIDAMLFDNHAEFVRYMDEQMDQNESGAHNGC